jgi:putative acetyltransferase
VIVRRETAADHPAVAVLLTMAFDRADGKVPIETWLTGALRVDEAFVPELSLVAEVRGEVVGHVLCTRATIGGADGASAPALGLGLGPIGVLPTHRGRGVGSALMHAVLGAADALGEPAVVLLGDPNYYARFGFVPAAEHAITPKVEGWAPFFQVRTLSAWRPEIAGAFAYAEPFDRAA